MFESPQKVNPKVKQLEGNSQAFLYLNRQDRITRRERGGRKEKKKDGEVSEGAAVLA